MIKNELSEFLIFINSGGVNTNLFKIPLNDFFLNLLNYIDVILIKIFPGVFALNRKIVLKNSKNNINLQLSKIWIDIQIEKMNLIY